MKLCKGISNAAVAAHADKCGRRKLAAMLVEHEPRSSKQVCPLQFFVVAESFLPFLFDLFHKFTTFEQKKVLMQLCYGKPFNCMFFIWVLSFQVPLLLSIGEEDVALTKATESGDTDLVYLVVFHVWQRVLVPCRHASPWAETIKVIHIAVIDL